MPKQVQKFTKFEGGINEGSDPKDVSDNELVVSDNIIVDDLGKLRLIGKVNASTIQDYTSVNIKPGYGLFSYSTDKNAAGNDENTDWIAVLNNVDGNVELRHTNPAASSTIINDVIDIGGDDDDTEAAFYVADGKLRVSNGNLAKSKDTKWYGHIKENFYQTTQGDTSSGTPVSQKNAWVTLNASPKNPKDLNTITLQLHNGKTANPSHSAVGATAGDKVILSYIKSDNGGWNGVFSFGMTFVYKGGGESSMEKATDTIATNEHSVAFQMYIPIGTSNSTPLSIGNGLGDDRITKIRIWFKEFESKDYYLLTTYNLLEGGSENKWKIVNTNDTSAYGIFDGTVEIRNTSDSASRPNYTTENGTAASYSYAKTEVRIKVTNNADANGFSGRTGYIRLYGTHVSPLYAPYTESNLGTGYINMDMTNKAAGTQTLKAELLDESFNILAESTEVEYEVTESGRAAPPTFTSSDPNDYQGNS